MRRANRPTGCGTLFTASEQHAKPGRTAPSVHAVASRLPAASCIVRGSVCRTRVRRRGGVVRLSGLETLVFTSTLGFCNVGERCNIAGSIAFKKLILDGKYDDALEVAKKQARSAAFERAYGILAMCSAVRSPVEFSAQASNGICDTVG